MADGWGSIVGAVINGVANYGSSRMNYKDVKKLQERQQQWAEQMSSTAHQREVEDLRAAGLNPLLSVTGGNGASTPTSGMGQPEAPSLDTAINSGVSTALQMRQQKNQDKSTDAQIKNLNAQTDTEATKQQLNIANSLLADAERIKKQKEINTYDLEIAKKLEEAASRIKLNLATASANQMNAKSNNINATTAKQKAEQEININRPKEIEAMDKINFIKEHPVLEYGNRAGKRLKYAFTGWKR